MRISIVGRNLVQNLVVVAVFALIAFALNARLSDSLLMVGFVLMGLRISEALATRMLILNSIGLVIWVSLMFITGYTSVPILVIYLLLLAVLHSVRLQKSEVATDGRGANPGDQ